MAITLKTGLGDRLISSDVEGKAFDQLPVIDISRLNSENVEDRKALALEVQKACIDSGFFYISNHGVPSSVLDQAFEEGKKFFAQPIDKKMEVDHHKGTSFKGYVGLKGEQVDPASRGDIHEAFDVGPDPKVFEDNYKSTTDKPSGNLWPSESDLPGFKPAVEKAFSQIMSLGQKLFPLIALALDLPETYFDDKLIKDPGFAMRLLHYPPQSGAVDLAEIGIGAHTDYECFTLLTQHGNVSALQVLNAAGEWVRAPPIEGTIVVNLGDQLQIWTNGVFKSTIHRAINRTGQDRMSIPFFFGVDYDVIIEPLSSCISDERPAKYKAVKAGEYVEQRMKETYVKVDPSTGEIAV